MSLDYIISIDDEQNDKFIPKDWENLSIEATYDNNAVQPNISTNEIEFVQEGAQKINKWVADGNIFEGPSFKWSLNDGTTYEAFSGFIDLVEKYVNRGDSVTTRISSNNGLDALDLRSQAITYGYLESEGKITQADYIAVPYVVNTLDDSTQIALLAFTTFITAKILIDEVLKLQNKINDVIEKSALLPIGPVVGPASALAFAILQSVYVFALATALITYMKQLKEAIFSDVRYHKGIKLKRLLEVGAEEVDLTLSSSIFDRFTEQIVFLPAKTEKGQANANGTQLGISTSGYYGYTFHEILRVVLDMFKAKIAIKGDVLHIEPLQAESSVDIAPFWTRNASYTLPDIYTDEVQNNAAELKPNYLLNFTTDSQDGNTIDDFTGTNYLRLTNLNTIKNKKNVNLKGLEELVFPFALASRKDELTLVESLLNQILKTVDKAIRTITLGLVKPNLSSSINNRIGMMKLTQDITSVPKILLLNSNNKIPLNHRLILSAKALYNNFHKITSWVEGDGIGQYEIYEDITIPFGFGDFLKLVENSYFYTINGELGKIDKINWTIDQQQAVVSYRVQKRYTTNLTETFIEA